MSSYAFELGQRARRGRRGRIDPESIARDEYGLEVVTMPLPPGRGYRVQGKRLIVAKGLEPEMRRWKVASALGFYLLHGDTVDESVEDDFE